MPTSTSHGRAYIEPERHDELSSGVAVPPQAEAREERTADGKWRKGARTAQSAGGQSHRGKPKLVRGKALTKAASALHRGLCIETAQTEGGGICDRRASLMLRWAAEKTEMAEKAKADGDVDLYRRLTESARMDLLYAREHAAKAAAARPRGPVDPLAAFRLPGEAKP
jgi:hypothetical protein